MGQQLPAQLLNLLLGELSGVGAGIVLLKDDFAATLQKPRPLPSDGFLDAVEDVAVTCGRDGLAFRQVLVMDYPIDVPENRKHGLLHVEALLRKPTLALLTFFRKDVSSLRGVMIDPLFIAGDHPAAKRCIMLVNLTDPTEKNSSDFTSSSGQQAEIYPKIPGWRIVTRIRT